MIAASLDRSAFVVGLGGGVVGDISGFAAAIYQRGIIKQRAMHSLQARITETTTSSLLVKPLVAHGTIAATMPANVVMTYTDPESKTITTVGEFVKFCVIPSMTP